jgi:hypothetical protein
MKSLSREELLNGMAFAFQQQDQQRSYYEYELLLELVHLQCPPSTPVHPKAIPYRSKASPPKLDYYYREESYLRWIRPRLFQLLIRCGDDDDDEDTSNRYSGSGGSELNDILRMAGITLPSKNINNKNANNSKKKRKSSSSHRHQQHKFEVIARKKIAPWGDIYGLGCTKEQQEADSKIMKGTRIGGLLRQQHQKLQPPPTACFAPLGDDDESKSPVRGGSSTAASILRMLQVASRGHFFRSSPMSTTILDQLEQQKIYISTSSSCSVSYIAAWLQPTERWFSLSMYLASRYQIALWDTYQKQKICSTSSRRDETKQQQKKSNDVYDDGFVIRYGIWNAYEETMLQKALIRSVQFGLKQELSKQAFGTEFLRDSIVWSLIVGDCQQHIQQLLRPRAALVSDNDYNVLQNYNWKTIIQGWTKIPLVEVHNPIYNTFHVLVLDKLEEELVFEMEHAVCNEAEAEMERIFPEEKRNGQHRHVHGTSASTATSKRRNNKKRKSCKKNRNRSGPVKATNGITPLPAIPAMSDEDDDDQDSDYEENYQLEEQKESAVATTKGNHLYQHIDFPNRNTSSVDRNRNIVMVLGILDDILENAFVKVGLPRTPDFVKENKSSSTTKSRSSENTILVRKKKVPIKKSNSSTRWNSVNNVQSKDNGMNAAAQRGTAHNSPPVVGQCNLTIPRPTSFDLGSSELYRNQDNRGPWGNPLPIPNQGTVNNQFIGNPEPFYPTRTGMFQSDFRNPFGVDRDFNFGAGNSSLTSSDNWPFLNRYQSREQSILTDFFQSQDDSADDGVNDDDDMLMAASTSASISSSTYKDTTLIVDSEDLEDLAFVARESATSTTMESIQEVETNRVEPIISGNNRREENMLLEKVVALSEASRSTYVSQVSIRKLDDTTEAEKCVDADVTELSDESTEGQPDSKVPTPTCRSPSPEAPGTPPPTLSPILLSLADLKVFKNDSTSALDKYIPSQSNKTSQHSSLTGPGSLPSSPIPPQKKGLTSSWSKDDLRIEAFRDDQDIKQQRRQTPPLGKRVSETPTYKSVAVKSLARPIASTKGAGVDFRTKVYESSLRKHDPNIDNCARSETAIDGQREDHHSWHHEEGENHSVTRDETTTITSGVSQRVESEEIATIREERNIFRDMCLTLGAEVAKLKAMLAAQHAVVATPAEFQDGYTHPMMYRPGSFDPHGMQPFFHGMNGVRPGPMSDAGFHRGEHESQVSEDEVYEAVSIARVDAVRRMSSSQTGAGSDASIDFNNSNPDILSGQLTGTMPVYDSVHSSGLQSRLTKDILRFLSATSSQLRKLDGKRKVAVQRFSRLVKTIWPRAQVKLYGSYMSGLCLPSSDLDFVVCLPAVHKKVLALAPGVLEGRNAINETSQKLLARELKGESWIDPRSIKLIERTVVPVIKVSTKDTRARMIQLDISFDSPEHHGLEANEMVAQIMEELPLIRPLVLVLKQFLLDRCLLTAYTGGLSSYCLFLMVARYLQDQPPASGDCGSLLMGFLDFYGN